MNKPRHPVDEFFSDALKTYKVAPSEAAKNAFLQDAEGLGKVVPSNKTGKKLIFFLLSGFILFTSITGIIISNIYNKRLPIPVISDKTVVNEIPANAGPGKNATFKEARPSTPGITHTGVQPGSVSPAQRKKETNVYSQPGPPKESVNSNSPASSIALKNNRTDRFVIQRMDPVFVTGIPVKNSTHTALTISLSDVINNNKRTFPGDKDPDYESTNLKDNYISAGLYYSPEWIFNILEANKNMRADNLGVEGTFHFGPYSLGTGIGISISKGTHEIMIGYNDYLGTYRGLDSIVFKWDAGHTHMIPVYYYTDKMVYDSLLKLDYSYFEKRYIYLQIPFKLGYDFIRNKRFTLGVRVSPVISILLQSKAKSNKFDFGKDRIVQLNNVTPERVQTNWQFSAGINAGIRINRMFSLEVEPDVRYYFNSVYEKPDNNKKPWSAGFRIAVMLRK